MAALLLTVVLILILLLSDDLTRWLGSSSALKFFSARDSEFPTRFDIILADAAKRFWLHLFGLLARRVRRIWRFCRRHFGWGIEILSNADFLFQQLL